MTDTLAVARNAASPEDTDASSLATRLGLSVAAVGAIAGGFRPGLGLAIGLLALMISAVVVVGPRSRAGLWCASWVVVLPLLILRDNRWLAICVAVTALAVALFSLTARASGQSLDDFAIARVFRRSDRPYRPKMSAPPRELTIDGRIWAGLRGLIIAAPVVWVFATLLSSADAVFAQLLAFDIGSSIPSLSFPTSVFLRLAWFVGLAVCAVPALRFGADRRTSSHMTKRERVGVTEMSIVFGSVCALFTLFIVSRLSSFGREFSNELLREEVRGGFFQLLWVAVLTVALVLAARLVGSEALTLWRVRALAVLAIALAAAIDVLALVRIAGYVRGSFSTPLRVWSFGFGLWLLVVLTLAAIRALGINGDRRWFTAALLTSWMGFVLVIGVFNPDQWIATYNFENAPTEPDQFIAVNPLIWLSDDATEVIIENIDVLRPMPNDRFDRMVSHLCATPSDDSWRDFNVSRSRAQGPIEVLCGTE